MPAKGTSKTTNRRLRWLGIAGIVFLLLVVVGYFAIEILANVRLQHTIDNLRAAGEPILPEDFKPAANSIKSDQNAATYLNRAFASANVSPSDSQVLDRYSSVRLPLSQTEIELIQKIIAANALPMADARTARACSQMTWVAGSASLLDERSVPSFAKAATLGRTLIYAALLQHQNGNDAESISLLQDVVALGDDLEDVGPWLIGHLVGNYAGESAARAVIEIAPDLRIGNDSAASSDQIKSLIAALLNDSPGLHGWREGMNGMRATLLQVAKKDFGRMFMGTAYKLDIARLLPFITRYRDAGLAANFPAAIPLMPKVNRPPQLISPLRMYLGDNFRQQVTQFFLSRAERKAAAVRLAIELYRFNHAGAMPKSLQDLVPNELTALPADPFAADGRTFGYLPNSDPPIIYSVGENGVDDGGSTKSPVPTAGFYPSPRMNTRDVVFYLQRQPKPPPRNR